MDLFDQEIQARWPRIDGFRWRETPGGRIFDIGPLDGLRLRAGTCALCALLQGAIDNNLSASNGARPKQLIMCSLKVENFLGIRDRVLRNNFRPQSWTKCLSVELFSIDLTSTLKRSRFSSFPEGGHGTPNISQECIIQGTLLAEQDDCGLDEYIQTSEMPGKYFGSGRLRPQI